MQIDLFKSEECHAFGVLKIVDSPVEGWNRKNMVICVRHRVDSPHLIFDRSLQNQERHKALEVLDEDSLSLALEAKFGY